MGKRLSMTSCGCALALWGAACLVVSPLTHTFGFGSIRVGLVGTARAQTGPKSLEGGGSDAAMKGRKNNWTVGVAGGELSGTFMTFGNEVGGVPDGGDKLRGLSVGPSG